MTPRSRIGIRRLGHCLLLALFALASSPGCGPRSKTGGDEQAGSAASATAETQAGSGKAGGAAGSQGLARYRQSFQDATRDDVPPDCEKPPPETIAGKSVGVLYERVRNSWDDIKLVTEDGKLYLYRVTLVTDQGDIEIELHPDWAPNHVRSFLALCGAGYYDRLTFDRRIQQVSESPEVPTLDMIEAGCPLGSRTQDHGSDHGSIGYWLKAEFSAELKHDEGMVGAWHSMDPDTAGCRFYICLSRAPTLDGRFTVFGNVRHGLDVARRMFELPHRIYEDDEEGCHHFDTPPVIRKAIVHPPTVDKPAPVAMMDKGN